MSRPLAYSPEQGQKFQLLVKCPSDRAYGHCDYAADRTEKNYLLNEYRLAYGAGFSFKTITLPAKYWPKVGAEHA